MAHDDTPRAPSLWPFSLLERPDGFAGTTADPFSEYVQDFCQRSIIFMDILRRRGNQQAQITARPINSVLIYDFEFVLRGRSLSRPVNYALVRVIPPQGTEIDGCKRPVIVIDPRAGQGPGIGGFKSVSEIGEAFRAGHPVYFIGFSAEPVDGQTIEDIARAHTVFFEKVAELHPEAEGKPFIVGNCQAGWHAMMAACMRPDLVGPIMVAGAPLSYWSGVHGENPMRYTGGMLGGSWLAQLISDLGGGTFDGAWLISNFDNLNPANTLWDKPYAIWADPEKEERRYLEFENWWGDFIKLRGEELSYMVDNLFIGNKFSTGQIVTQDGTQLDLRNVKSPIVCFCSKKDNITPPQQALNWITDNYESVDEVRRAGQTILYCIHETAGHLAIFVGTKVAAKEHAGFVTVMDLIDCMPPGLYEIVITEKKAGDTGTDLVAGDYNIHFEERSIDDIRAFGGNSVDDDREFATVARVSQVNGSLYRTFLQPWVKAVASPQLAEAVLALHPLRVGYALFSDKNPFLSGLADWAEKARAERKSAASDNPFLALQQQVSDNMVKGLDLYRDLRDQMVEQTFHAVYGSPVVQALYGTSLSDPRPRPGRSPWTQLALEAEIERLKGRLAAGGRLEAGARALIYITRGQQRVDARSFEVLRRLLDAHPEVTLEDFKAALREQWAILAIDEAGAIAALDAILPADASQRRDLLEGVRSVVTAAGALNDESHRRLQEIGQTLGIAPDGPAAKRPRRPGGTSTRAVSEGQSEWPSKRYR